MNYQIPEIIKKIIETLTNKGFEAFLVGGCVRDILLHMKPKDWDITTNAKPEQIQALFLKTVYENKFGTVAVINEKTNDETLRVVEITPYRLESKYSDKRHPDSIFFTNKLEDDLKRRDFTINAMAMNIITHKIIDLFNGQNDLKNKIIRAVGNAEDRFNEDGLRILRAIRLATELGFSVSHETQEAIKEKAHVLEIIAKERIRDEFVKIIMAKKPINGIEMMQKLGVLKFIIPELEQGIGIDQNKAHKYKVWEHNLLSLEHAANKDWPLHVRLAALFHDIGKPACRRWSEEKKDWTFYGHEIVGAKMTVRILSRLKFPKKLIELAGKLVRYHLFFSDTEKITLSAVRRTIRNVGPENVWDLMKVRFSDRIGMARPKETPYRLRKYEAMIEEAMRTPLSVAMLKINGNKIMEVLKIGPGPKIGQILHILLEEVFDNPEKNTEKYLEERTKELGKLNEEELKELGSRAKTKKDDLEWREISKIREKWRVK
jgi:tRNA nucleotidyltransferase (CCA-adding enzyme)